MRSRRRIVTFAALACIGVLGLAFWVFLSRKDNAVSEYRRELRSHGERLTYAELHGGRINRDVNAITTLTNYANALKALWKTAGAIEFPVAISPGVVDVAWDGSRTSGTKSPSWEELEAALIPEQERLRSLRGILNSGLSLNLTRTNVTNAPAIRVVHLRTLASCLSAEALWHLRSGRLDEAVETIKAIAALAKANSEDYSLVSSMVQVAIGRSGLELTWQALQADNWTDQQLNRLAKTWEDFSALNRLEAGLEGDRATGVELWSWVRDNGIHGILELRPGAGIGSLPSKEELWDRTTLPFYRVAWLDDDELLFLRAMQKNIHFVRTLKQHGNWNWKEWETNLMPGNQVWRERKRWLSGLLTPRINKAVTATAQIEIFKELMMAAIALERHRLSASRYPHSLSELIPQYAEKPFPDPVTGRPLLYKGFEDSFLLYSTGLDGIDDGGIPNDWHSGPDSKSKEDAVWPKPFRNPTNSTMRVP